MERCRQPIRKDFTTLVAFMPAMRELLDKGALVRGQIKVEAIAQCACDLRGWSREDVWLRDWSSKIFQAHPRRSSSEIIKLNPEEVKSALRSVCQAVANAATDDTNIRCVQLCNHEYFRDIRANKEDSWRIHWDWWVGISATCIDPMDSSWVLVTP